MYIIYLNYYLIQSGMYPHDNTNDSYHLTPDDLQVPASRPKSVPPAPMGGLPWMFPAWRKGWLGCAVAPLLHHTLPDLLLFLGFLDSF